MNEIAAATRVFVLSSPGVLTKSGSSLVPVSNYESFQLLLGFDAQLQSFSTLFRQSRAQTFVMLAPEIFSSPESFRWLGRYARIGENFERRLRHVRFGPARYARAIRGSTNVLATVERQAAVADPVNDQPHASGRTLPCSVRQLLYPDYLPPPAVSLIDGGEPSRKEIPAAVFSFVTPSGGVGSAWTQHESQIDIHDVAGIHIESFFEFDQTQWRLDSPSYSTSLSPYVRRVLIEHNAMNEIIPRCPPLVVVPWNMTHRASMVPDLVEKIALFGFDLEVIFRIVLLPYNVVHGSHKDIAGLVRRVESLLGLHNTAPNRRVPMRTRLQNMFMGKVRSAQGIRSLGRLCSLAWVDSSDPESDWIVRRLSSCGIGSFLLGTSCLASTEENDAVLGRLPLCEAGRKLVHDEFGTRIVDVATPSVRDFNALTHRTSELLDAQPRSPPATPAPAPDLHRDFEGLWASSQG